MLRVLLLLRILKSLTRVQSNNIGYDAINSIANNTLQIQGNAANTTSAAVGPLSQSEVTLLTQALDTYAFNRSTDTSLNVRDNILRDHLSDGLPAQFVYEATDCRLFYTPLSIIDPEEQWRQAAEAAWGRGGCVAGSLGGTTGKRLRRTASTSYHVARSKVISLPEQAPRKIKSFWEAVTCSVPI